MNLGEYGTILYFSTGYDMSAKTTLTITFTKPDATTLTKTATVGSGNVTTTAGVFVDKMYAQYTFATGDVDQAGTWSARVTYTDAVPKHLISDSATFVIHS